MAGLSPDTRTILKTFDEIEAFVNNQSKGVIPEPENILSTIREWRKDAVEAPGRLRPLLDLDTIPSLAAVCHPQRQGMAFFIPIIVAWLVLGIAEVQYQSAGSTESFFAWWAGQSLGPATYSFTIAVLLLGIVAFRYYRDWQAGKSESAEAQLSVFTAKLCVQAARLMDEYRPLESAAGQLTSAADRLALVGRALAEMPTDVRQYLAAAQEAGLALAKLDEVTSRLASQVETLTSSLHSASGAVSDWDHKLAPIRETLSTLITLSATNQARSSELTEQLGTLAGVLPNAIEIASTSGQAAQQAARAVPELVEATSTLASVVSAVNASQVRAQELIDSAYRVVAFLDDRIGGRSGEEHWPPAAPAGETAA